MKFQGFVGPAYKLNSVNVDCQRLVNMYPEVIESRFGKEAQVAYFKSTPGLEKIAEVGTGPIRLVHVDYSGQVIVVSGTEVYRLIETVAGVESINAVKIGDIGENDPDPGSPVVDTTRQVKAVSGTGGFYGFWTIITDGSYQNYYYDHDAVYLNEDFGNFAGAGYPPVSYATQVEYIDGYAVYIVPSDNKFYVSDWNNLSVDALSFATAEGNPDNINALQVIDRLLYIFNDKSIEVYSNTGNADFPFERVSGGFISVGNLAEYSPARVGGALFWLGRDENGQGSVYSIKGLNHQRISTHAIEQAISSYLNPQKAVGYCYSKDGHDFYILSFEEATWCYDLSTGLWHERAFTNDDGDLERHRVNQAVFRGTQVDITSSDYFNVFFCGDYSNNKIYLSKNDIYQDDVNPITRLRTSPHFSGGGKNIFYKRFNLDMETGVGLDGSGVGSDPQVMLRFSNDGGHTWSSEAWASAGVKIGGIGNYKQRVFWNRLGRSRDRVFEIKITDPVPVTILGVDLDAELGET